MVKLYLAGPDVFYPDADDWFKDIKHYCDLHGLTGVSPFDADCKSGPNASKYDQALTIQEANLNLIEACDGVLANLTPFRGISADVGTAFEIGYAKALDKPVFAYSLRSETYARRVQSFIGIDEEADTLTDNVGNHVEDFDLIDNLMITTSVDCLFTGLDSLGPIIEAAGNYFKKYH